MPYQLPPDLDERVRSRMLGGGYRSEDDVLREALDALDERELLCRQRWDQRNAAASEQSRLGLSQPLDLDDVLSRVEKRLSDHRNGEQAH